MDVRDIKGNPPDEKLGDLGYIFDLQEKLVEKYQEIENFPMFPLDLDIRTNQILFKDFVARITEEIGEAYESAIYINQLGVDVSVDGFKRNQTHYYITNFNEEMADALHFMVEACLSINIGIEDLRKPIKQPTVNGVLYDLLHLNPQVRRGVIQGVGTEILQTEDKEYSLFIQGGRRMYPDYLKDLAFYSWLVTYRLQIVRNTLKNKPWKQTEMVSDKNVLKMEMINAFCALMDLFRFCGMTAKSITDIYWRKNQINLFRIQSKY